MFYGKPCTTTNELNSLKIILMTHAINIYLYMLRIVLTAITKYMTLFTQYIKKLGVSIGKNKLLIGSK